MSSNSIEQIQLELLNIIPDDGAEVSSHEARSKISERLKRKIDQKEFAEAQDGLIFNQKLLRGRRGIRAVLSKPAESSLSSDDEPALKQSEREMETPIESFLHLNFVPDILDPIPRSVDYLVQNTARRGPTAGLWIRPDITLATVTRYAFQPVPELELYGFELKCADGCSVYAIHEALAHNAFVHYSTVIVLLPSQHRLERNLPRMREQATEHGIGILRLKELKRPDEYELLVEARKKTPPVWAVNEFIETRFDESNKHKLLEWLKLWPQK